MCPAPSPRLLPAVCVSDESTAFGGIKLAATVREEWITLAAVQSDRVGRVNADLQAVQESRRPNLLFDAPFYAARADVAIKHAGWT